MDIITLTIIIIVVLIAFYVALQLRFLTRLKSYGKKGTKEAFVNLLGDDFKYKPVDERLHRYKWKKGVFTVKATFDHEGKLVGTNKITWHLFRLRPEILFM